MRSDGSRASAGSPPNVAAGSRRAGRYFAPERPGYLPWSHPAALGLAVGIAVAGLGAPAWWLLGTVAACAWRLAPGTLVVASAWLGWIHMQSWEARPDPLAGRHGSEVVLAGRSDGRVLRVDDPAGARVALAPVDAVPPGRVIVRGELEQAPGKRNPGGFDYRGYLARRGVTGQLYVGEVLEHRANPDVRGRMQRALERGLPGPQAALVAAMTLGVRDDLGDLRDRFAAAGLAHVLALSGLHVGVLVGALALATRRWRRIRTPLLLAALGGFVLLVGPTPSVVRATGMVAGVLIARWRGGGRLEPWPALSLAAVGTLIWNPSWLFEPGFQLSYLAVIGLLVFAPPLLRAVRAERTPWWHPRTLVLGSAAISIASQLPLGSLLMAQFGQVPLLSPLANVAAIPLATVLVPLGFLAAALGAVWSPLAAAVGLAIRPVAWLLLRVADVAAGWPALAWGEVGLAGHATYALAVTALALLAHGRLRLRNAALVAIAASVYGLIPPVLPEIVALDVGQGDSVLIRLPGRTEVLIDGGGSPFSDFDVGAGIVVPALRALGVDELELVVATHPDTDHMEGLTAVLAALPVHRLVVGVPAPGNRAWDELMAAAETRGVAVRQVRRGERISLGEATFSVLHPEARSRGASNEDSVGLAFAWRGAPVALFLGDVSGTVERELAIPASPVLMVPHHGSRRSTSEALLRAARPQIAIVSVGRNGYGHPARSVLERLAAAQVEVRTTQTHGAVRISVPDLLRP